MSDAFKNIRVYWLAFVSFWGIILLGFDTGIAGGVVANEFFQTYFGLIANGVKDQKRINEVSSNVVSIIQAGAFFGSLFSIPISSRIGRRRTLIAFIFIFTIGAILTTIASGSNGLTEIYSGRVISGVGVGGISAVSPAYVSECSPKQVRGRITGIFQIMASVGVMISFFVNYGIGIHIKSGEKIWRIPFGFQLVLAGIMCIGLFTVKESPRWLAAVNRNDEAIVNLAYFRREPIDSPAVIREMAEIRAAIDEERQARKGLGLKETFFGKGNFIRFVIAFVIFVFQQWSGQNLVNYYAPQTFAMIGYSGTKHSLFASGIYGIMKVVSVAIFVLFFVESLGRKLSLFISSMGMGTLFFIVGAILKTHPPPSVRPNDSPSDPPPASKAMAAMLYIYVCFYGMGWGPTPWVYCSDIFPTRTRHYGLALANASQSLWNFVVSKVTPDILSALQYKIFFMFAAINIGGMAFFSLLIPETTGRSLEDMDVIFGSVSAERRQADISRQERALDSHRNEEESKNSSSIEKQV